MELFSALLLGLVGSVHCAGMCGPLVLALPAAGTTSSSFALGRVVYNLGRIGTYGLLGVLFGLVGQTFAVVGLQRWVSLTAGVALLLGLLASSRYPVHSPVTLLVIRLKSALSKLIQKRSHASLFGLGALNGLLPCGLVYAACAGAVASGGLVAGIEYMLVFGLGTVPMMLGIGLVGKRLQPAIRFRLQRLIPACVILLGVLLILRGMALGIPYLSPDLLSARSGHGACH